MPGFGSDVMIKVASDIERVGWSAISVFPCADDPPGSPAFTYSVGLRDRDHPELIVFGLDPRVAHGMIREVYGMVVHEGVTFRDGDRVGKVLVGYDVIFRALPPDGRPLLIAKRHYGVDELPALQIVWPDEQGRHPGDDGCDAAVVLVQDTARAREEAATDG